MTRLTIIPSWTRSALKCFLIISVCAILSNGFPRAHHHRHHHHGRHNLHHEVPNPLEPDAFVRETLAESTFESILRKPDENPEDNVPKFMKILLRESEDGFMFRDSTKLGPAKAVGDHNFNSLAGCWSPTKVSVDPAGALELEFAVKTLVNSAGCWLVLSVQAETTSATSAEEESKPFMSLYQVLPDRQRRLVEDCQVPIAPKEFLVLDVSEAVRQSAKNASLHFLVDVASRSGHKRAPRAASMFQVAGKPGGPLLVWAMEKLTPDGPTRVWKDDLQDRVESPRFRRHARRHKKQDEATSAQSGELSKIPGSVGDMLGPQEEDGDEFCHLEALEVTTQELGWSGFMLSPSKISINICVGKCPSLLIDKRFNQTTNSMARNLLRLQNDHHANIPGACCVPTRFRPVSTLFRTDSDNLELVVERTLSADRCGCR